MNVLIIDNYDSFTFNLYQSVGSLLEKLTFDFKLEVIRNDQLSLSDIKSRNYDRIIISPGPGHPAQSSYFGICDQVLLDVAQNIPILGVCLGMQGLAYHYGGQIQAGHKPVHGKTSRIKHDGQGIFRNIPQEIKVMRYHSLVVSAVDVPACLAVTARVIDGNQEIMAIRHRQYPIEGVQFHPESFATAYGQQILINFLEQTK